MPETKSQPIIIIKKKPSHGGHHGGAWKVAYADFATAMMALFIVLWMLNSSKEIREAVGGYFRDPSGASRQTAAVVGLPDEPLEVARDDMDKLKDQITDALQNLSGFQELQDQIQMTLGKEGLRVELLETANGTFFESGSALPTGNGNEMLVMLAQQLGKLQYRILIEGHSDAKPFSGRAQYSNWELSADRANAARRLMEASGLRPGQVVQVRGFADRHLRYPDSPLNPGNRRISVLVLSQPEDKNR